MSNNILGININNNSTNTQSKEAPTKIRSNSLLSVKKISDIVTQVKPISLCNYSQPLNIHKSAFTPSNKSRDMLQPELLLPQKTNEYLNKKTLILDLDETLVHSNITPFENNDITLEVEFDGILYDVYVLIRPGAEDFIKKLSKLYEIIIFTASISKYASPLIDKLDKEKNIKYRLFRDHCTYLNGIYIKELKRLNRDLKDVIIVDNSPLAYSFDVENGLPIKSWYDDMNDKEFDKILPLLEFLSKVEDVRNYIGLFVENNEIKYDQAYQVINTINNFKSFNDNKKIDNNKDCNKNNEEKKQNNIFCLYDFLSTNNNNKNIGNILNKNKLKAYKNNLKIEDYKIQINPKIKIDSNSKNNTDKYCLNKNKNNINLNILIENAKTKKNTFRNKNTFRFNQKLGKISIKHLSNNENNTKINSILPLSLSLTNSTNLINIQKKDNNMNNLKLISIKDLTNNLILSKNKLNNNIKSSSSKEKIKNNRNIYNSIMSNTTYNKKQNLTLKRNSKSFKLKKDQNLLINPQYINQKDYYTINNKNKLFKPTLNFSSKSSRSKSTGNFIKFQLNKDNSKTPKSNQRLYNIEKFKIKFTNPSNLDIIKYSQTTKRRFGSAINLTKDIRIEKLGLKNRHNEFN